MSASFIFLHHSFLITLAPLRDMDLLSGATLGWSPGFSDSSHWHLVSGVTYFAPRPLNTPIVTFMMDILKKKKNCQHVFIIWGKISNSKSFLKINSLFWSLNKSSSLSAINLTGNSLQVIFLTLFIVTGKEPAANVMAITQTANILNKSFIWIIKRIC